MTKITMTGILISSICPSLFGERKKVRAVFDLDIW
jgi:hypothetical protein